MGKVHQIIPVLDNYGLIKTHFRHESGVPLFRHATFSCHEQDWITGKKADENKRDEGNTEKRRKDNAQFF
jgi:hypothetical protein